MRSSLGLLLLAVPVVALAATPQVEETLVVSGTLTVSPDGSVQSYHVHALDKVPPAARNILQATIPHWEFVPIVQNGKAVAARTEMYVRVVADFIDRDHARIRVAGEQFGCQAWQTRKAQPTACPQHTSPSYANRRPPMYPMDAARVAVGGEVLMVLRVGRDGKVEKAAIQRVNLYTRTDDPGFYRQQFAAASMRATADWRFNVPTAGPNATKAYWDVLVPINYVIRGREAYACGQRQRYGQWCAYLPGPVQNIPWAQDLHKQHGNAGALAGGEPFLPDPRFVLKTVSTARAQS